jgi:hypothetical protein
MEVELAQAKLLKITLLIINKHKMIQIKLRKIIRMK